jgi:uncharacterized membrane protein YhaH (DUF805 family)
MNWYLAVLKKYAEFTGRARRKEYWMFALINFLIYVVLVVIDVQSGMSNPMGLGVLSGLYSLAVFVPSLAVSVRRLHDTDRSGWWLLILLVPLIGLIVFLVFMLLDSQPGENRHGPSPKYAAA